MDLRKLKTLIDLVSESNIFELEITEAEGKVRIVKGGVAMPAVAAAMAAAPAAAALTAVDAPAAVAESPGKIIKSPMVGTVYLSSSPGAKPLVELGSEVKEGDPVCIIEAMKIMNEIESDCAGRIKRILCENGQAVEFGQQLFIIE